MSYLHDDLHHNLHNNLNNDLINELNNELQKDLQNELHTFTPRALPKIFKLRHLSYHLYKRECLMLLRFPF